MFIFQSDKYLKTVQSMAQSRHALDSISIYFIICFYNGASYFRSINCLKYTSKIRMIKLENFHKFCRKKHVKYVIHIGDNTMRKWKTYIKFIWQLRLFTSDPGIRGTAELRGDSILYIKSYNKVCWIVASACGSNVHTNLYQWS